jgi:hypothetical protein
VSYDPGHWLVVRSRAEWDKQATDALDAIKAANGGTEPATLRAAADVDRAAFGRLIEALVALGARVDDEMMQLAGLRDVGDWLALPTGCARPCGRYEPMTTAQTGG